MTKIREMIRLHGQQQLSMHQISGSVNVSVSTVHRLLQKVREAGLGWPEAAAMSDEELAGQLQKQGPESGRGHRVVPEWSEVERELSRKGVTRQLLWEEYSCLHGGQSLSYPRFCELYRKWQKQRQCYMPQQHRAGEKVFVDYSGQTVPVTVGGSTRQAQIFVAALGFSNYTYAEASWTQKSSDWLASHTRMLNFFGGVPRLIVPDNLKSGVTKACYYDPQHNPAYQRWAEHYATAVLPARPKKPRDKAKVENAVQQVQRQILAPCRKHRFTSLKQLNDHISGLLGQLNARPFQKRPGSRLQLFETADRPALGPLPKQAFEHYDSRSVKVHQDCHIQFEHHQYSVPHEYVGYTLQLHASASVVRLYYGNREIASHLRSFHYGYTTEPEHMPKNHRAHEQCTPQTMLWRAGQLGPNVRQWCQMLLDSKRHPQQAFRVCLGLFDQARTHSASRIDRACQIAHQNQMLRLKQIKNILANRIDLSPAQEPPSDSLPQQHDNVRGASYFESGETP